MSPICLFFGNSHENNCVTVHQPICQLSQKLRSILSNILMVSIITISHAIITILARNIEFKWEICLPEALSFSPLMVEPQLVSRLFFFSTLIRVNNYEAMNK